MLKAAASVDAGGTLTVSADQESESAMKAPPVTTRFAYSTGSRPLDGYTIKRGVGAGGFGEVYFAISDAGKEVALKRIQRNLDVELRGVSQCLNLKHANLVAIYDIRYDQEGQAWVVMEYVRGECLKDVLDRNPNGLPLPEVMAWMRGVTAGVAYLHDHGIVHRDLKPGNIFLDEGVVKIGDYGLSKYISCSRRSGQTESVGTFHYMAPEIGRGVYGKEIDVYALGVIFYELLTGRVPFDGESSHEIIMKHLTALPELGAIAPPLRPTVERALVKDPVKRYRQVAEFITDIERAAAQLVDPALLGPAKPWGSVMASSLNGATRQATSPPQAASEPTMAEVVQKLASSKPAAEEPIAVALRDAVARALEWWNSSALSRGSRVVLGVLFVFLFFTNAAWIMPVAIVLGSLYLVYFGIRAILLSLESVTPRVDRPVEPVRTPHPQPAPTVAQLVPEPQRMEEKRTVARKRRRWSEYARQSLRSKSLAERLSELLGAYLMAAVVAAITTYLGLLVADVHLDGGSQAWSMFAWLSLVSLTGVWALLIPAKYWEGAEEDSTRRRLVQLVLGVGVGCLAFGLADFLGLSLQYQRLVDTPVAIRPPTGMFGAGGIPSLSACAAYFGGLFLIVRWWQQADPLRPSRFSFWNALGTLIIAGIWQVFWPFPQPYSLLVPVIMSVSLQLSASWMKQSERTALKKHVDSLV